MGTPQTRIPALPTLHTLSYDALGLIYPQSNLASGASAVYPAASRAIFIPFHISDDILVTKLFAFNGAAVSGNVDVGIYTAAPGGGRLRVSAGGVAQATTSDLQIFDVTDTLLTPGDYYLAAVLDNTTGTFTRLNNPLGTQRGAGISQMASAYPLPTTVTFAAQAVAYIPLIGLLQGRTLL